jgi:hypothetical protein
MIHECECNVSKQKSAEYGFIYTSKGINRCLRFQILTITFKANIPNSDDPLRARSDSEGTSADALLMKRP